MPGEEKKMLDKLLNAEGKEILVNGTIVMDKVSNKTFSEHVADSSIHKSESDINRLIKTAVDALKNGDVKTLQDTVSTLSTTVNNFLTGEDDKNETLDRLKELVAAIQANKTSIDALTKDQAKKTELETLKGRVDVIEPKAHQHSNSDALNGVDKAENGNLTYNGKELNGETGIAISDSAEDPSPSYTAKIRMVLSDFPPSEAA